ncbi:hypothetical protein GCM10025864_23700 [Luteimicrobium album]|uniref:Integral membrane protein n=2 Tax=Luteimicrobium album TaxID=1054550 RepID=A0ABQ6I1H4_9MICO|nr:hypothetical protein GCM10025864_23700 [Luteimicrobium album]
MPPGELALRALWALAGVAVLAVGSAVLLSADVGVDPFTASNSHLGLYQLLVNAVLLVVVVIVLFTAGASAYMTAGIGTAPYDAIAPIVVDRTGALYRVVRVAQDLLFVGLAIVLGGPVGVGTVMTAFFAGPLIDFFTREVNTPLLHRLLPDPREPAAST